MCLIMAFLTIASRFCLFLVLHVLLSSAEITWKTKIVVSPTGRDQTNCGTTLNPEPCCTLDFALNQASLIGMNYTMILLKSGTYNYSSQFNITDANFFAIQGETGFSQDVEISCQKNASLVFTSSSNVLLQGIKLRACGALQKTGITDDQGKVLEFSAALFFIYGWNVRLLNIEIAGTSGVGVFIYNVGGTVDITDAVFVDNEPRTTSSAEAGNETVKTELSNSGGGVYVQLNNNSFNVTSEKHSNYTQNSKYWFKNCSFIGNKAPKTASTHGGGLSVLLGGSASSNSFTISDCVFKRNRAQSGGGLHVKMDELTQNNTLSMENTAFIENFADLSGGGARLENFIPAEKPLLFNKLLAKNCSFVGNSARTGGGASVYGTTRPIPPRGADVYFMVVFESCVWLQNKATAASAIGAYLVNFNEDGIGPKIPFHIEFDRCTIVENQIVLLGREVLVGQGAIYTVQVPVVLKGNTSLVKNNGTAMVLESSTLEIHDAVRFTRNVGYRGGAVAMYGLSTIMLMNNSRLIFEENRGDERGGAMFISGPESPFTFHRATGSALQSCFFTYQERNVDFDEWNTEIVFVNNSAPSTAQGNSVYATTLQDCRRPGETRRNNTVFKWKIVTFQGEGSVITEVSTDPIDIQYDAADWNVSASQSFSATVRLIDETDTTVYGIVYIRVQGEQDGDDVSLMTSSSLFLANNSVDNLIINGKPRSRFNVSLQTLASQIAIKTINNLTLRDCSPGFVASGDSCICGIHNFSGISGCNKNGRDFYLRDGFWAGTVDSTFATYPCPEGYCNSTTCTDQTDCTPYTPENICREHREGVLCGSCKAGYTVLLGSEECSRHCSNLYLLLFVPYGLVLFVLVMLVMLINLDVFTGYLNAWLYSYQVMALLTRDATIFDPFIQFLIGLSNAQFKLGNSGTCIADGLDDADKLAMLYVLPYATMLFVGILGRFVRAYPNWCFSRRVKAPFRAVCTMFVLCYTDITQISLKILHPAYVGGRTVLFQDGNVGFFEGKHIAYGLIAIFSMLLIVIPFPLTLMFTPFFTKCWRPIFNLNNFKPYYDAFQGCFKDRYRWCSAFYFMARFYLLVIATYVPPQAFLKHFLIQAACVFILAMYIYLQPYKEEYDWINKLDAVLLTNLWIIAVFSTGLDNRHPFVETKAIETVIKIFSYTPLVYLLGLLGVMGYRRYFGAKQCEDERLPGLVNISDAILGDE